MNFLDECKKSYIQAKHEKAQKLLDEAIEQLARVESYAKTTLVEELKQEILGRILYPAASYNVMFGSRDDFWERESLNPNYLENACDVIKKYFEGEGLRVEAESWDEDGEVCVSLTFSGWV